MVPFKKMPYETCWQFMNCSYDIRKECIVYKTDMKEPCWVSNQARGKDGCGMLVTCKTCPWFLKKNPGLDQSMFCP
jgi:hypothetical protein